MGLLDLLLPERCAGCGRIEQPFCPDCRSRLAAIRPPLCHRCGAPTAWPVERCRECAGRRVAFARARAAVAYDGVAVRLVAAWKEAGRRGLADEAAAAVTTVVGRPQVEALTYVPAAADRLLWRGHNPALALAEALAEQWTLPLQSLLERRGAGRRQRGLGRSARRGNVAGVFVAAARPPPTVGVVDDVYTTGSTLAAAAAALRRGGAERVEAVTFARALRHHA
jgi:predicted amidophosphoribosyltransferase